MHLIIPLGSSIFYFVEKIVIMAMDLSNNHAYNPAYNPEFSEYDPGVCSYGTVLFRTLDRRGRRRSSAHDQRASGRQPVQEQPPPYTETDSGTPGTPGTPRQPQRRQPQNQQQQQQQTRNQPSSSRRQQQRQPQQQQQQRPRQKPPSEPGNRYYNSLRRLRVAPSDVQISLCVKYTIFFFNVIFWILGGLIFGFGVWGIVTKSLGAVEDIANEAGFKVDPLIGFVVVGGVIFVLAFCGCIGALRENSFILKIFTYSLILIFITEVVIGILGYFYSDKLIDLVEDLMFRYILSYFDDPDTQFIVDGMQKGLLCCGSVAPMDWENNIYFSCDSPAKSACSVPFSCCLPSQDAGNIDNLQCGYGILAEPEADWRQYIYHIGCATALQDWIISQTIILGAVGGVLIILQCVAICLGKSLIADIENVKSYW